MRKLKTSAIRFLALLSVAAVLGVPRPGRTQTDDSVLFTTIVPPNVLLLLDNSGSMNHLMWHPAYDDTATPTCTQWTNTSTYYASDENDSDEVLIGSNTFCGNTRTVFSDPGTSSSTRWSGRYLNWYFSDAADAYANEIIDTANGTTSDCLGSVTTFGKYRRTRIVALRQVMREVTCLINEGRGVSDGIRFGIAQFRDESDPHGGFVSERIDDNTTTHMDAVEADIQALEADAWTPLGESLFHSYLYFMSRSGTSTDRPLGVDGSTRFPAYTFQESDGEVDSADAPPSPVQYPCQKSFVIVVTDGEPTKDDFDTTASNLDVGFSIFDPELIGDYIAGDETEEVGNGDETAWYMDDIAKFMHDTDFRPDMDDDQVIDVYTVGFTTSTVANDFLDRVADAGNGLFFPADDAEELSTSLLGVLTDIVEKTTSFTASTVPASRTTDGADFYTSFFLPFGADPFWQGHLQAYHITAGGDIEDSNGDCALVDPTVGECNSGAFLSTAVPFWDAGSQIPAPASRTLYTSVLSGTPAAPTRTDFNSSLTSADLGLLSFAADGNAATAAPNRTYGGTRALNEEGLADEIVQYERGCEFGTGVQTADESGGGVACTTRSWRLADIFHSNPIVVGRPGAFILDPSYLTFKSTYATRDRVIYAGSNGGFTHGFHAGDWDASATPTPKYDEGTGVELFGFMPAWVRDSIKYQPEPNATSEHYYVDGSPDAADVWHYATATQATKASDGSEWHTMLVGGLRQGGETYYALDVTNPAASTYPALLWEFPVEGDATYTADMGETWGVPVMTRIKVKVGSDDHGGAGYERWVVIVTAGYDETGDPNLGTFVATGTKGRAIFVLDATTGEVLAMESLVGRSDSSVTAATESYAIASTPSVLDTNFDGYADLVYIGDLGGNVWKWVIHDIAEDRVNDGSGLVTQPSWTFRKFFEAPETVDGAATYYKSIFYPPSATLYRNKLYIAFGTGERTDLGFEGPTATTDDNNRFYVITDPDPYEQLGTPLAVVAESDLTDVTSDASCQSITTRGFYFIVENGEKFVTNSEIFARDVIVASFTPTDLTDPCESGGGQTSLYVFDVVCSEGFFDDGGNPTRELNLGAGFPTDPRISAGPDGRDNVVFIEKSRAEVESIFHDDINAAGSLLYWRELP
jgi:type IV pilus assembly protein PilY1